MEFPAGSAERIVDGIPRRNIQLPQREFLTESLECIPTNSPKVQDFEQAKADEILREMLS